MSPYVGKPLVDPRMAGLRGITGGPGSTEADEKDFAWRGSGEDGACRLLGNHALPTSKDASGPRGLVPDQPCKACDKRTAPAACFGHTHALMRYTGMHCSASNFGSLPFRACDVHTPCRVDLGSAPAGADQALGSQAQKEAGEAQAQTMSTRGFVNPGGGGFTPDTDNTAPTGGDVAGMSRALFTLQWP